MILGLIIIGIGCIIGIYIMYKLTKKKLENILKNILEEIRDKKE